MIAFLPLNAPLSFFAALSLIAGIISLKAPIVGIILFIFSSWVGWISTLKKENIPIAGLIVLAGLGYFLAWRQIDKFSSIYQYIAGRAPTVIFTVHSAETLLERKKEETQLYGQIDKIYLWPKVDTQNQRWHRRPGVIHGNGLMVRIRTNGLYAASPGDRIKVRNLFFPTFALGQEHLSEYYAKESLLGICRTQNALLKTTETDLSWASWCRKKIASLTQPIFNNLKKRLSPLTYQLFSQLFLGKRIDDNQRTLRSDFEQWGVVHVLARSGLHLVFLILLFQWMLSFVPLGYTTKRAFIVVLLVAYGIFTFSSISFARAFLMALLAEGCRIINHPPHMLHILSLSSLLILLYNPLQLFFLDFQFSFLLTFILILMAHMGRIAQHIPAH